VNKKCSKRVEEQTDKDHMILFNMRKRALESGARWPLGNINTRKDMVSSALLLMWNTYISH